MLAGIRALRSAARVPSLAARALPAGRCSPPRHVTRCEMGQLSSSLRLLVARCKTSMSGGPESMARQEAVEKAGTAPALPAGNVSFWVESTRDDAQAVPTLQGPLADVDVLVLGGGIVGITTGACPRNAYCSLLACADASALFITLLAAYLLRKSGLKVGLLESGLLCEGVTGHTTAKLTSQHGLCYAPLIKKARPSHHTAAASLF